MSAWEGSAWQERMERLIPEQKKKMEQADAAEKASRYPVTAECNNCGVQDKVSIKKGTKVKEVPCSNCGVKDLKTVI